MKISVIIPSYQPKEYLWECLNSLLNQTLPKKDFEVILVLNGCNEPYKQDIERYISTKMQGLNVNFIHTLQGGVSNARNIALDQAKGEYVTFIDDDDYISNTYLEHLLHKASKFKVVLSNVVGFCDNGCVLIKYKLSEVYKNNCNRGNIKISSDVRKFFSGPCMKIIHKDIIKNRRFDTRFDRGEDSLFMFLISDEIEDITFTTSDAIYYRRFRLNSAISIKRSFKDVLINSITAILLYSKYLVSNPFKYNLLFYLSRIGGAIRYIFKH